MSCFYVLYKRIIPNACALCIYLVNTGSTCELYFPWSFECASDMVIVALFMY